VREYIICENLVKRFGRKTVVKGVNMFIGKGEVVGLLGPNGAGKTTIFNMILGIVVPTSGRIFLSGIDITNFPVYKRARMGITYLQQETSVFNGITVWENLELVLSFFEKDRSRRETIIEKLLKDFGIYELKDQLAGDLSGGEKRRLELARMMTLNPSFLLLDEPFVGIDPKTVKDIQRMVLELRKKGLGIIITDHNVDELVEVVDRLYIIHKGSIIAEGPPERALTDKKVREVFLGV